MPSYLGSIKYINLTLPNLNLNLYRTDSIEFRRDDLFKKYPFSVIRTEFGAVVASIKAYPMSLPAPISKLLITARIQEDFKKLPFWTPIARRSQRMTDLSAQI